jgi:hypothetical protein
VHNRTLIAAATALLFCEQTARADDSMELKALVGKVWENTLKQSPVFASSLGDNRFANEIGEFTLAAQDRQAQRAVSGAVGHNKALKPLGRGQNRGGDIAAVTAINDTSKSFWTACD